MILEVAILDIKPGQTKRFEQAFGEAGGIIASMGGYISHQLQRCVEKQNRYLLLVNWETLADHEEGFRQSAQYQKWKSLLQPFFESSEEVEHYTRAL